MTDTARLGTLAETPSGWQLTYERHLDRPPAIVWRSFTEPDLLRAWFPTTIEGELTTGGPLRFEITDHETDGFDGSVIEVDEPHRFAIMWGPDRVQFDLAAAGSGTDLTLTVLLEELGKAARDGAGWHQCLDRLEQQQADDAAAHTVPEWPDLNAAYAASLGPGAATIGPPQSYLDAHPDHAGT